MNGSWLMEVSVFYLKFFADKGFLFIQIVFHQFLLGYVIP
jgi:hypothetical protein